MLLSYKPLHLEAQQRLQEEGCVVDINHDSQFLAFSTEVLIRNNQGIIKMKFSKKSRYGLTSLIDLSVHSKNGHVALNSIAERNDISPQYLEQVFAALRRAGIVKSIKGPQGGYLLNHPAEKITVAEILEALDGTYHIADEDTAEESDCKGIAAAIQTRVIDEVNRQLDQILINLTLADLVKEYQEFEKYDESMYYI